MARKGETTRTPKEMGPMKLDMTVRVRRLAKDKAPKRRAKKAVDEIRRMAARVMGTKDVKISMDLNERIWSRGIKHLPQRLRVRLHRKRNEDQDAKEPFCTVVEYVECADFHGLKHEVVRGN